MSIADWLGLSLLCLAGAASPGPSLAVVLSACVRGGRNAGLVAAWSHAVGVGLYAALTVFGLSALLAANANALALIQLCGAAYLLWLAHGLWNSPKNEELATDRASASAARDGFAVVFLNPKLAVFMLALFSQFLESGAGAAVKFQMMGTAFFIDGAWYTLITLLFTHRAIIDGLRNHSQTINRVFAIALAGLALALLASLAGLTLGT
ncbi:MAG: LysE family translocator [Pseudomonadota bacterium]